MVTIRNQTEKVIAVWNAHFSAEIPIGETAEIEKEIFKDDCKLFCRYFSAKGEEVTVDFGATRGGIRNRLHIHYENESTFPLVTAFEVEDNQVFCLKEESVCLRHILLFKTVRLKKITVVQGARSGKEEYLFRDENSKRRFIKLMRISVFLLPIAAVFLLTGFFCLFSNEFDVMQKIISSIFCGGISLLILEDVYYFFSARKWRSSEKSTV